MFDKPSLMTRIAIGKAIGLVVGLIAMFSLPLFLPDAGWMLRWGILLWYTTVGAFIGVMGVITWHPILKMPLRWWFRAPLLGAWMNFVLVFFAYEPLSALMLHTFGEGGILQSPFWFVLDGALVGLLIGAVATWLGGEGRVAVDMDRPVLA